MKTSREGKIALIVSEGIVTTAYLDAATPPVWTVGIGHTLGAGAPNPLEYKGKEFTIQQAMNLFESDLVKYEAIVNRNVKVDLLQREFDALVHFVYNIGEPNFKKSKLLANLNAGNKNKAFSEGFHGWLKPASLKSRRDRERAIALKGEYGPTRATIFGVNAKFKPVSKGTQDISTYKFKSESEVPSKDPIRGETNKESIWVIIFNLIVALFSRHKK